MPVRIQRELQLDLTVFVVEQELSVEEQLAVLERFYEEGPSRDVIWDLSEMTGPRPEAHEMHSIVALLNRYRHLRQDGRTAFVGRKDLDFGMARMGAMLAETKDLPWQLEVFRSRAAALAWLGADSDQMESGAAD